MLYKVVLSFKSVDEILWSVTIQMKALQLHCPVVILGFNFNSKQRFQTCALLRVKRITCPKRWDFRFIGQKCLLFRTEHWNLTEREVNDPVLTGFRLFYILRGAREDATTCMSSAKTSCQFSSYSNMDTWPFCRLSWVGAYPSNTDHANVFRHGTQLNVHARRPATTVDQKLTWH